MDSIYSVSQLNQDIKELISGFPPFQNIFVQGEISNYKLHTSGHHYLTLKDDGGAIPAVLFRSDAARLRFQLQNGMEVIARGRVSSFPKTGQVQLYISDLMPSGAGAMHIAFEQLKQKLNAEGLFGEGRKRKLPQFPQTIAIITSPTGAAVHDMIRILGRRWPAAEVQIYPALVQGLEAPADLCRALRMVNQIKTADLIIIGRGGGSAEDLWAFNDEKLARAIADSCIPVVSAVGHEPDITIADYVADMRAATPSAAAEIVAPDASEWRHDLRQNKMYLKKALQRNIAVKRNCLSVISARFYAQTPQKQLADQRLLLDHLTERLQSHSPTIMIQERRAQLMEQQSRMRVIEQTFIQEKRNRFLHRIAALDALSPLRVLSRGYSVTFDVNGKTVTDASHLSADEVLLLRFAHGSAKCCVLETRNKNE